MEKLYFLSIVGFGARGLHALECFYSTLSRKRDHDHLKTIIFEPKHALGTGLAWDPEQAEVNTSNISDRALAPLNGREAFQFNELHIPEFPSYLQWLETTKGWAAQPDKDSYSARKVTGEYLAQRAQSILNPLIELGLVTINPQRVVELQRSSEFYTLATAAGYTYDCTNVILALGHVSTAIGSNNNTTSIQVPPSNCIYRNDPYSDVASKIYRENNTFIIKGFGLAMIDVVSMITGSRSIKFKEKDKSIFLACTEPTNLTIIPYSIDGLPKVPKPVGKQIDDLFDPVKVGSEAMISQLKADLDAGKIITVDQILHPIATVAMRLYQSFDHPFSEAPLTLEEGIDLLIRWFKDPSIEHDHLLDIDMDVVDYMKFTCKMAYGTHPFSIDYTVGQVWRYLQIDMYYVYTHQLLPREMVASFVQINEMAKRYSFGPPVSSILKLIALQKANILNLDFIRNPQVNVTADCYTLSTASQSIQSNVLIDCVLPRPNLALVNDPLIICLKRQDQVEQYEENLGINVTDTATHVVNDVKIEGLYSIGRNVLGSEHGVDALLECFNTSKMHMVIDGLLKDL